MTERLQESGGLLWWRDHVAPPTSERPITVEDVTALMHDLWRDNRQGPGATIYMSVETADRMSRRVSFYRRRANRKRIKMQKRAIGRHRW